MFSVLLHLPRVPPINVYFCCFSFRVLVNEKLISNSSSSVMVVVVVVVRRIAKNERQEPSFLSVFGCCFVSMKRKSMKHKSGSTERDGERVKECKNKNRRRLKTGKKQTKRTGDMNGLISLFCVRVRTASVQTDVDNTDQPEEKTTVQPEERTRNRVDTCMKFDVNDTLHRECERKRFIYRMYAPFLFSAWLRLKEKRRQQQRFTIDEKRSPARERERQRERY